jgi:broad specificity phosphatase PhoE
VSALSSAAFCKVVKSIYASNQPKALEPATAIAAAHGLAVTALPGLAEVSRGTEAYLSAADYDNALARFFSSPETSVAGWERAQDALARFQGAIHEILKVRSNESVAVVSHAMVLTLFTATLSHEAPTLARWHDIGFGTVTAIDVTTMHMVTPFVAAPYDSIPLP